MKKIMLAVLPALALSLAAPVAHADEDPMTGPVSAADNWNFTAGAVCLQEVAIVAALTGGPGYVADHDNNCSNGNAIDHS